MEKMAARVYCGVLLCLSGCLSTTEAAPGTNLTALSVMASQSSDCVKAKPGVCPLRKFEVGVCAELCVNDRDCPNYEKCCSNGCGHQCTAPYTVKPGVCPIRNYDAKTCTWLRFMSCANDGDCPEKEKCCRNGCGLECMNPVKEKPTVCPFDGGIDGASCRLIRFVPCVDDSNCASDQKCCYNGCGRQCMVKV